MNIKDIVKLEETNQNKIYLIKEGLFLKAFERSAWFLFTNIKKFKPTKRSLKVLNGKTIISVGFPYNSLTSVLSGYNYVVNDNVITEVDGDFVFDIVAFETWKNSTELIKKCDKMEWSSTSMSDEGRDVLIKKIREFDMLTSTPLDCFNFISDIKHLVKTYVK